MQNCSVVSQELMILCEEWWEVTKESTSLFDIYKIYREANTRKTIRKALILECVGVVKTAYMAQDKEIGKRKIKHLLRMFICLHQNFLHLICYVLHRMGLENCEKNIWAVALRDIVYKKFINCTGKEALSYSEERRNQEI
jgi:hypothetical protein